MTLNQDLPSLRSIQQTMNFIFARTHELGRDLIHLCPLAVVIAVMPNKDTELE